MSVENPTNTYKLLRVASGLSQRELAEQLDISPSYVSLIESGEREPTLEFLRKFSRVLGIPISVLLFQGAEQSDTLNACQREENARLQELYGSVLVNLMQAKSIRKKKKAIHS